MSRDPISGEWLTCETCGKIIYGSGTRFCAEHRTAKKRKRYEQEQDPWYEKPTCKTCGVEIYGRSKVYCSKHRTAKSRRDYPD